MAFGGAGGTWIQQNKKVLNPYYGAMMLHCGGIREQIAVGADGKEAAHHGEDEGYNH